MTTVTHKGAELFHSGHAHGGGVAASILLSLPEHGYPTPCLMRAHGLASLLRVRLHVLRVLPAERRNSRLRAGRRRTRSAHSMVQTLTALGATQTWISEVLGDMTAIEALAVKRGAFVEQTSLYAAENGGRLIVLSPQSKRATGIAATLLARTSGIRVLVAREAREQHTIVAATDLGDPSYPVLHDAAQLGLRLEAPVVALHKLDTSEQASVSWPWSRERGKAHDAKERELAGISQRLCLSSHTVIDSGMSPTEAILREARARNADLVVIGTRSKHWLDRPSDSVCAQVVSRARRSVLVTPFASSDRA